eukprot:jgi/Botrbrau1/19222/Bobra.0077s0122.1
MPPDSFRCRLQYQLLIPIFQQSSQCPCCFKELDVWGDHAVHCTSGGDVAIVGRHYSVRNGLDAVLTSARQRVTRRPAFPTPVPGQERRMVPTCCISCWLGSPRVLPRQADSLSCLAVPSAPACGLRSLRF